LTDVNGVEVKMIKLTHIDHRSNTNWLTLSCPSGEESLAAALAQHEPAIGGEHGYASVDEVIPWGREQVPHKYAAVADAERRADDAKEAEDGQRQRADALEEKTAALQTASEQDLCIVCMDAKKVVMLQPCRQ
jgi:hypothetical protein